MNRIQKKRAWFICVIGFIFFTATSLILYALKQNINVYFTPTDIVKHQPASDYVFRLGGVVKKNSIKHDKNGMGVRFIVTDMTHELSVQYTGVLPDLFREEKGVIAAGTLDQSGVFMATDVLAKHDENYTPIKLKNTNEKSSK